MSKSTTPEKLHQPNSPGISETQLKAYKEILIEGYPFIKLAANCRLGYEIHQPTAEERQYYRNRYQQRNQCKVLKFVPASGAASRMFKDLFASLDSGNVNASTEKFFAELKRFAFYPALMEVLSIPKEMPLQDSLSRMDVLRAFLLEEGLSYGNLPKGLILFHRYADGQARTAFEEHFHEAQQYAASSREAHIHFTIPDTTSEEVEQHLKTVKSRLERSLELSFHIETSLQKPATDTPAIYADDHSWVMQEDGSFLLRPAGHGALLENLNGLDADVVFIKNIDNVVPDRLKETTVEYKEVLAGMLLEVQEGMFGFLRQLDAGQVDEAACAAFFRKWFQKDVSNLKIEALRKLLDRPVRVCGMVKNEGEPGGGPFIVDDGDGQRSLQIVEKAQVDTADNQQLSLLNSASHFNPVDLVVSLKNFKGEKYNLLDFRKADTGMVVSKTHLGRDIKALELPGLWNGSMHHWNTVFVEVPIETFNPVKTVFDLLRPVHQGV